jgi:TIR domain
MARPREYFEKDASRNLRIHAIHTFTDKISEEITEVTATVAFDFEADVKYALLYIPESAVAAHAIDYYLSEINEVLKVAEGTLCASSFHGTDEHIPSNDLRFSGRITVYTGTVIAPEAKQTLHEHARSKDLRLIIRDGTYLQERMKKDIPQAFICHDSRDKEPFVRELASKLQSLLFSVWYDEYSLKAGDSLRASIEKGLKECRKCILILSPNFLTNEGWKAEFDSVFTREILEKQQIMIPVWHGVSKEAVFNYSPRLLDKVGVPSSVGVEEVARKIIHAMPL